MFIPQWNLNTKIRRDSAAILIYDSRTPSLRLSAYFYGESLLFRYFKQIPSTFSYKNWIVFKRNFRYNKSATKKVAKSKINTCSNNFRSNSVLRRGYVGKTQSLTCPSAKRLRPDTKQLRLWTLFDFTVTLKDGSGLPVSGNFGNDAEFNEEGTAEFTLKHGEIKTISGIPEGFKYTVAESGNTGYKVESTGANGYIAATLDRSF